MPRAADDRPRVHLLAGLNGAGTTSYARLLEERRIVER